MVLQDLWEVLQSQELNLGDPKCLGSSNESIIVGGEEGQGTLSCEEWLKTGLRIANQQRISHYPHLYFYIVRIIFISQAVLSVKDICQ